MRRWAACAISVLAVGAVTVPGVTDRDSFPLSNYPMFSYDRGRVADIDTAVGVDRAGRSVRLSPEVIAGGGEVILAAETVSKSVQRGDTDALCREIAARADGRDLLSIQIVTERHDVIRWFEGHEEPLGVVVHASCAVLP
jgi:hypothetical protein